jgi:serine protease
VQFVPAPAPLTLLAHTPSVAEARTSLSVRPGESRRLQGELVGGRDLVRLRSSERVEVRLRIQGRSDARIAHVDPLSLAVSTPARELRFFARGVEDIVLHGSDGAYELGLEVRPLHARTKLDGHMGALLAGDTLTLEALNGDSGQFSCAQPLDLRVSAVCALDAIDGNGALLASLPNVGGTLTLPMSMLAHVTLVARGSSTLRIEALESTEARPLAQPAPADAERIAFALEPSAALVAETEAEFVFGQVLVRGASPAEISARGGRITQTIPETSDLVAFELPESLLSSDASRVTLAVQAAFEASPSVEWAEPNFIRRIAGGQVTPNDAFYNLQWHYDLIKLPQAWSRATGDASIIVAVIDTGSRPHPDLDGNTIAGFDFISDPTNAADGDGIDSNPIDPGDGNGLSPSSFHGTHVAGTVGAVSNNGLGVAGVNWDCSLMHLRVLGVNGGTDADIAQSVRYAARLANSSGTLPPQRAHVMNLSLGGPGSSSTMQSAVTAARNAGVVVIAAAGNNNSGAAFFPASYSGVVSVSAVDFNSNKAPYSNFGPNIDVAAPGGDVSVDLSGEGYPDGVLSTLVDESSGFAPQFVFYQGTSMACPHVAGLAALMLDVNPTLTVAQIETILTTTTVDLGAAGRDDIFGFGLIQADAALAAAAGQTPPTPLLSANPGALSFGTSTTQLTIAIANTGGGSLDVGTPTFTPTSGGAFAALSTVAATGSTDVSAIVVSVNRTGLTAGSYSGTVTIPSNGGTAQVSITMSVAPPPAPENVDLFLLLVDSTTLDTITGVLLNPTTTLSWQLSQTLAFEDIPEGSYLLVCGSDDDGDDAIFGPGDTYTGAWPLLNDISELPLARGDELTGLDFVVGPSTQAFTGNASRIPPQGFALRNLR